MGNTGMMDIVDFVSSKFLFLKTSVKKLMRFIFGGGNLVYLINEAGNLEIFASFKFLFY